MGDGSIFVYDRGMTLEDVDVRASSIAAAIGEPARARMLYCLVDGRARTSTELAMIAEVTPSTASAHLQRLKTQRLVKVLAQGKHRYYSLEGTEVAAALEALSVVAGGARATVRTSTPRYLRSARTCYDHIAGSLGVALHDRFVALDWMRVSPTNGEPAAHVDYVLTPDGEQALRRLGIDLDTARAARRRFAYACVDWSERRPHLAGALGAAILALVLKRGWAEQDLESRLLRITPKGRRELLARFGVDIHPLDIDTVV
jgi:DNA-binding transcriptional ArsR family regulator